MPYVAHIHYADTGTGRPILFIHPPALSLHLWPPVTEHLRSSFRCIAVDLRGHGKSGLGDQPWTFSDAAADLALLTRGLDLRRPALVGYSCGGAIGLQAVLDYPELFGPLVLVGSFSECTTLGLTTLAYIGLAASHPRVIGAAAAFSAWLNRRSSAHLKAMLPDARGVRPASLRSYVLQMLATCNTSRLGEVQQPVLLVYGTMDLFTRCHARKLDEGLVHGEPLPVQGADHRVPSQQPLELAIGIGRFLSRVQGPGADGASPEVLP